MASFHFVVIAAVVASGLASTIAPQPASKGTQVCQPPATAPRKLEKIIGQCQDEIKYSLLQEALTVLGETLQLNTAEEEPKHRDKREAFTGEEKRIAGCLLHCVYRKLKAVDKDGFPTPTGLVKVYSEGVKDRNYYLATIQAVQQCMARELHKRRQNPTITLREGYACDVAYDMFNCVSDRIELICGTSL